MIVYMICTYGEYGPENSRCTTDRAKLHAVLNMVAQCATGREYEHASLSSALEEDDAELLRLCGPDDCPINLSAGWGGFQLVVMEAV
jgi:hypothetical protein